MDPRREKDAIFAGRRWAEEKAAALEGTSPHDWPEVWDAAWSGDLHLERHFPKLTRDELTALVDCATDAARRRWEQLVEWERAIEDTGAESEEARAVVLFEALRAHVPSGLDVGRDGARVYIQDVADAAETTVHSLADASRAISDWQERHFGS